MPPEPTISKTRMKKRSTSRRDGRDRDVEDYRFDGGHSRELELKRSRGKSADIQLPLYCLTDPLLGLLGLLLNSLNRPVFWCGRSLLLTSVHRGLDKRWCVSLQSRRGTSSYSTDERHN
jgi:hypothetical protein